MKKNTLQKIFTVALTGAMAVTSLAGCGSKEAVEPAPAPAAVEEAASEPEEQVLQEVEEVEVVEGSGIESWTPFAENVTLKIPVYDRGGEVDVTSNYWTEYVQKEFGDAYNITVEYVAIPRGDVLNAYANLGNSKSLPTILMEYDFDKEAQWADDGYLAELDLEQFAQVAPTYYEMMVEQNNLQYTALNGTTYFALAERPYWNNTYNYATFYRADWLEQLGLEYPQTYEETLKVYEAIVDAGLCKYPAGGQKISGAGVDQNYGFRAYPQDEVLWATTGGYAIPPLPTDATKKLIERQNDLFNKGYLNPEFYTREATDHEADFIAGNCFSYLSYVSPSMPVLDSFYETNPDGKLAIAVCPGLVVDDEGVSNAYRPNNAFGMMIGFSSLATEDEIKAAEMYMEWFIQPENLFTMQYGIEGETFEYNDNGVAQITNNTEGQYAMPNNNKDYYCVAIESYNIDSIEGLVRTQMPTGYPDSDDFYEQLIGNYNGMCDMAESGYIQPDCNFAVAISAATENQENLLGKYEEFRTKLTTCAPEEFEALYEDLAQQYLDAGYQDIIDERKQAYEDGFTTKLPK